MSWYHPTSILDKMFEGGIIFKGINGLVELMSALLLFFISPENIRNIINFATQRELRENPHNIIANFLISATQHINTGSKWFAIVYLTVHGVIKLIAVVGLLKNQLWAYPFSLITLGILMLYQIYKHLYSPYNRHDYTYDLRFIHTLANLARIPQSHSPRNLS